MLAAFDMDAHGDSYSGRQISYQTPPRSTRTSISEYEGVLVEPQIASFRADSGPPHEPAMKTVLDSAWRSNQCRSRRTGSDCCDLPPHLHTPMFEARPLQKNVKCFAAPSCPEFRERPGVPCPRFLEPLPNHRFSMFF